MKFTIQVLLLIFTVGLLHSNHDLDRGRPADSQPGGSCLLSCCISSLEESEGRYPPGPLSLIGNLPGIALIGSMNKYLKECRKIYSNVSALVFPLVFLTRCHMTQLRHGL